MQVPTPIIIVIQKIIDTVLTMDPQVQEQLSELSERVIKIKETGTGLSVFAIVVDQSVQILRFYDGKIDTTISGSAPALLALSKDTEGIFSGEVSIEGDLEVGKSIRKLMESIDLDLEEHLSKFTGDSVAHLLGRAHRQLFSVFSGAGTDLKADVSDYITEETKLLVSPYLIEDYFNEIDRMRDSVDRLEARINLFEQRQRKK